MSAEISAIAESDRFDYTSAGAWAKAWAAAAEGAPPTARRTRFTSVTPFPHRRRRGLSIVTVRFGCNPRRRSELVYNTTLERRLALEIGVKSLLIVPGQRGGVEVRFLVSDSDRMGRVLRSDSRGPQ